MKIRPGRQDDYESAMLLVAEFSEESLGEYGVYLDPEKLKKTFDAVWKTSFVVEVDGQIVGILAGQIITDICSGLLVFEEVLWYTLKKHRRYGLRLYTYVEQWCRDNNIKRIMMSVVHNSMTDKLFELYEKMGFRPQETKCVKEL